MQRSAHAYSIAQIKSELQRDGKYVPDLSKRFLVQLLIGLKKGLPLTQFVTCGESKSLKHHNGTKIYSALYKEKFFREYLPDNLCAGAADFSSDLLNSMTGGRFAYT